MEITRSLNRDGNYNTKLYSLLNNMCNIQVYNDEHDLRNPLGIYNVAFSKVLRNINTVIDMIICGDKKVHLEYKNFLESINEFVDDGYNIIKCYYPKNASSSTQRFADKWLESINSIGIKEYKLKIEPYIQVTRYVVNKIKHEHGRLGQVYINTTYGTCGGYFLERYHNQTLEPDETIHKRYQNTSTAFSYVVDIMKNFAIIYIVSEEITNYIKKYLLPVDFDYKRTVVEDSTAIQDTIKKIWQMPLLMFPNEYQKAFTTIDINDLRKELIIKYPANITYINKFNRYKSFKAEFLTSGDGTSVSFSVPYFGGKRKEL